MISSLFHLVKITKSCNGFSLKNNDLNQYLCITRNPSSRVSGLSLDSSAPSYENLNMDHIAQLVSEGFQQAQVIRALGITR